MHGVPVKHVAVDLDCETLGIPADRKRCDYLFFGREQNVAWVSPIGCAEPAKKREPEHGATAARSHLP